MHEEIENTDAVELRKFESLADDWWNPEGHLQTLHTINPIRLKYINAAASLANRKVLDAGCGGGLLTEAMAAAGAIVTGIDANATTIKVAREHARLSALRIEYQLATAEQHAQAHKGAYDLITCMELLEHVPDPAPLLAAFATMLKAGGDLVIATLNRNARSYTAAILTAEYILGLLPRGTHDYARFIKPSELSHCLRQLDFTVMDISGMRYLPLVNRCLLNNDPAVNYLLHARAGD